MGGGWGDHITISIAYVQFCFALAAFVARYASVFWYTNKCLTLIFAAQLAATAVNAIFGFNGFATLYCVCYSHDKLYPNVHLSVGCQTDLALYMIAGAILLLSTITVFQYGTHYFHEKSKIVERRHNTDSYVKQTTIVVNSTSSGCQGYAPHSCAMLALVLQSACKGPLLYDMVSLMRLTSDQMLTSAVACEVTYMILWVGLWFCLTVKQKWQFRLLDYVPLRHLSSLSSSMVTGSGLHLRNFHKRCSSSDRGGDSSVDSGSLTRVKRNSGAMANINHVDHIHQSSPVQFMSTSDTTTSSGGHGYGHLQQHYRHSPSGEDAYHSDDCDVGAMAISSGTDTNLASSDVRDYSGGTAFFDGGPYSSLKRSRGAGRRNAGQRVTFEEGARSSGHFPSGSTGSGMVGIDPSTSRLSRSNSYSHGMGNSNGNFVTSADVHSITPPPYPLPLTSSAIENSHHIQRTHPPSYRSRGADRPMSGSDVDLTSINRSSNRDNINSNKVYDGNVNSSKTFSSNAARRNSSGTPVHHDSTALSKDYRTSIRSKCDEYYSSTGNLSASQENVHRPSASTSVNTNNIPSSSSTSTSGHLPTSLATPVLPVQDPMPTLMSSFRDKVRESSIAASNFKERERHMLERYSSHKDHDDYRLHREEIDDEEEEDGIIAAAIAAANESDTSGYSSTYTAVTGGTDNVPKHRKVLATPYDGSTGTYLDAGARGKGLTASSLARRNRNKMAETPSSTGSGSGEDSQRNSLTNTTLESSDLSLPPVMEDIQLGRIRPTSGQGYDLEQAHDGIYSKNRYQPQQQHQPHLNFNNQQQQHNPQQGQSQSLAPNLHPNNYNHYQQQQQQQHHQQQQQNRPLKVLLGGRKPEIGRRDSANYSLPSSSQDNSSNESDNGGQLCSQV